MDDKTPTPDQTPDHTPHHTPGSVPDAQTVRVTPTPEPTESKPGRKRALLIGGGIAAAVVLAGGGIAIGAAIGDEFGDDDDSSSISDDAGHDDAVRDDSDHADSDDSADDEDASSNGSGSGTGIGAASADELIEVADAAREAAEGDVTSIDAKRDGTWEVQLTNAAGDETEVRVDEDLAASVISTDPADGDDTGASLSLDDETIRALVTAALDEADGMITDLDVDGDDVSPYDASVLTADNRSIDIDFGADFAVIGTDIDD
ncbi:hypothetical protein [Microbacterium sp. TWP3-1-2b2]|uniref:hypothetical protein n=1 Tax=Microbacterium sp. TWP3-1-2b2 TaxID=2804651 RepID=UPI003CEED27F